MTKICPTCGQPLPQLKGKRICADCHKTIGRHDKYFNGNDGRLHHYSCQEPTGYGKPDPPQNLELIA